MPRNPVMMPAIEHATARKFKGNVDSISWITIRKGRTAPMTSKTKAMASSLTGFSISAFYL